MSSMDAFESRYARFQPDRVLLALLYSLGTLAAWFALIGKDWQLTWAELYFPVLMTVFTVALLWNRLGKASGRQESSRPAFDKRRWMVFLLVTAGILAWRLFLQPQQSMWLDEDFQLLTALHVPPVYGGALQHQPPLDLALMDFFVQIFGMHEWSARLGSMLFGAIEPAFLFTVSWMISDSVLAGLGVTSIYFFHSVVMHYGYEARPVSLGLLGVLLIAFHFARLSAANPPFNRTDWIHGVAACLFALLGLGLQPPFFLLALSIAIVAWPSWTMQKKFWLFSQSALALVLFLPIQFVVFKNAPPRFSRLPGFHFRDLLGQVQWANFEPAFLSYLSPVLVWCLLSGFVAARSSRKYGGGGLRTQEPSLFLLVTGIVFLTTLVPFFKALVDWPLQIYYLVAVWPCLLLSVVFGFRARESSRPSVAVAAVGGLMMAWPLILAHAPFAAAYRDYQPIRADYRSAYASLKREFAGKEITLFPVCLNSSKDFCPNFAIGVAYGRDLQGARFELPLDRTNWTQIRDTLRAATPPRTVVLLFDRSFGDLPFPELFPPELSWVRREKFQRLDLLIVDGENTLERLVALAEFLDRFAVKSGVPEIGMMPILVWGQMRLGHVDLARQYVQELLRREVSGDRDKEQLVLEFSNAQQTRK